MWITISLACPRSAARRRSAALVYRRPRPQDYHRRTRTEAGDRNARLLLLLPERQQSLRRRAADHAGDADFDLTERCRRNAAERDGANADLAPEVEIAARIRALGFHVVDRG